VKIIYAPKGGEPQEFVWEPDDFGSREAELIEEAGGVQWKSFGEWANLIDTGGFRAWRVALWVLLMRQNPTLDLNEVQPSLKEVMFLHSDNEEKQEPGKDEPADTPTDST